MTNPTCCTERILVVEDDRALCSLLSTLLGVEGYRHGRACDGAERAGEFSHSDDAVVIDVMLPRPRGSTLARA